MKSDVSIHRSSAPLKALRVEHRRSLSMMPFIDTTSTDELTHKSLALCNRRRVRLGVTGDSSAFFNDALRELATVQLFEAKLLNAAREAVVQHANEAPAHADDLLGWLGSLRSSGPGQLDPLNEWLATEATEDDVRWFVRQEVAADRGVDELSRAIGVSVELAQLRNIALLLGVELSDSATIKALDGLTWEALARSNLVTALANSQRWRHHAVGALVAISMAASKRAMLVESALTRLGNEVSPPAAPYDTSFVVDHLVRDELTRDPVAARGIAEGVLMWMHAHVRCLDRYRGKLVAVDTAA